MKKNTKVTSVANNPFAQIFAKMDPAQASALLALLGNGVTVKKAAAKVEAPPRSRNPRVVEHHAAAAAGRAAYKAVKAKAITAGEAYYEVAKAANDAAIERFYA